MDHVSGLVSEQPLDHRIEHVPGNALRRLA